LSEPADAPDPHDEPDPPDPPEEDAIATGTEPLDQADEAETAADDPPDELP
jgi:hypothetical protein